MTASWREVPLARLYRRRAETGSPDLPLLSVYRDLGVVPRAGREDNFNRPGDDLASYQVVRPGDLVLNKMKTWQGSLGISDHLGIVSPAYFVAEATTDANPRFMHHLLRSAPLIAEYGARSKGIRPFQWDLPWEEFRLIRVRIPRPSEQSAIAHHLDFETARIDGLIAARRAEVELLRMRRQAFVSASLDVGASVPVRRLVSLCTSGPRGWGDLVGDQGVEFIRSANLTRDSLEIKRDNMAFVPPLSTAEGARSKVQAGDTLVGITGANTGWTGLVRESLDGAYVSQHVAILRPHGVLPEWLAYSIASDKGQRTLLGSQYGGTKTQLGLEDLKELVLRLPSLTTQRAVIERVERLEAGVTSAMATISAQVDLLVERRQALIATAVTGQPSFPGVAA